MSRFVDTNVLLYSISTALPERAKRRRAQALLEERDLVLSVQVLQEFYVQSTRAAGPSPLAHEIAAGLVHAWRRYPVVDITTAVLDSALEICNLYRLSYWDSAIIAAAGIGGCARVLTEDLQHGTCIAGVTVLNPFL